MEKPTIFFSHSSKDKDLILPIKNKIENITANVIDIFMSSDGQSIPFGHNWVHKIEEGLNKAKIMFVFVTPTSINSSWIYFEAGFAYSKNIEVIPVGLGVNIGTLNPPLNLLQGFDINSSDSLNNFISIINKKFNLSFQENFDNNDYNKIENILLSNSSANNITSVFQYARTEIAHYIDGDSNQKRNKANKFYSNIKNYLDENNIQYSVYEPKENYSNQTKTILVQGIRFDIKGYKQEYPTRMPDECKISVNISTLNFESSFVLLKELLLLADFDLSHIYLHFYLNDKYDSLKNNIEISSVVSQCSNQFTCNKDSLNMYTHKNNIKFGIIDVGKYNSNTTCYVLGIYFEIKNTTLNDINELVRDLECCKLIYKKENNN